MRRRSATERKLRLAPQRAGRWLRWFGYYLAGLWRPKTQQLRPPPWPRGSLPEPEVSRVAPVPATPLIRPAVYGSVAAPAKLAAMPDLISYPQPSVTRVEDAVILPKHIVLDRASSSVLPAPITIDVTSGLDFSPPRLGFDREAIGEPVFLTDCRYHEFGHLLLEAVPALLLLDHAPPDARILTSLPLSRNLLVMAEALGVDIRRFRHFDGPLFVRLAYVPDRLVHLGRHVHPLAREAFARIKRLGVNARVEPVERIFLSRSRVPRRRLANEQEIEALFERLGFAIIHPEQHTLEEQVALMAGAKMVAGLGGSAMHLTVFSSPETRVLILASDGWLARIDVLLDQIEGQLAYVFGNLEDLGRRRYDAGWRINPSDVEAGIRGHFGL